MSLFSPDLFLKPALLFGVALAALPIILHLMMRSKPKKLLFPALRLIQKRKKSNVRRLRLRHWWLLLLRMLVIALLVFALARPSLPAANYSLTSGEGIRLAVIAVVAVLAYLGVLAWWRRRPMPQHAFAYRRTILRASTVTAFVLLFLLLVAWPYQQRVSAEIEAPAVDRADNLPTAAVFLFDTSASMEYRHEGKTRLEQAQTIANDYLSKLPQDSKVAVTGSRPSDKIAFRDDLTVAGDDIEAIKSSSVSRPLNERIRQAVAVQVDDREQTMTASTADGADAQQQDRYLREIYLFTDLAANHWQTNAAAALSAVMERHKFVHVYIIDVGVEAPQNTAIESLKLSRETLPAGMPLTIDAIVTSSSAEEVTKDVEVLLVQPDGSEESKGKRSVTLLPGEPASVQFTLSELPVPYAQGRVRIVGSDPLDADNSRFFTTGVRVPPRVLLVTGPGANASFFEDVLAPQGLAALGRAPFRVETKSTTWLQQNADELETYDVVCLLDVPRLDPTVWTKLSEFVGGGRGLLACLGSRVDPVAWNSDEAAVLLPGELLSKREFPAASPAVLDLKQREHPLLKPLFKITGAASLFTQQPVYECWNVAAREQANVSAWFATDGAVPPTRAILDRPYQAGRVVMITTPFDYSDWNDLPRAGLPSLVFTLEMMNYLSGLTETSFNFSAGAAATLRLDTDAPLQKYLLRKPDGSQTSRSVPEDAALLVVEETQQAGNYKVIDAADDSDRSLGFSVNSQTGESDFTKITGETLDQFFGPERYRVSDNLDDLERLVTVGRLGKELFPQVIILAIVFFCAEHLVANRFYESENKPQE